MGAADGTVTNETKLTSARARLDALGAYARCWPDPIEIRRGEMTAAVDQLLTRYETGQISRRELLGALTALAVVTPAATTGQPAVGVVEQLNHVTVFIRDVE